MATVAVIGAGWAGLTAALSLQAQGHHVTLYERSPAKLGAGGRASTAYAAGDKTPFALDNGQHVLLAAYTETLEVLRQLEVDIDAAFLRLPAAWYVPTLLSIQLPVWGDALQPHGVWARGALKRLPLLWAMLTAKPFHIKTSFSCLLAALRLLFYRVKPQETVQQWLTRLQFPAPFDEALWQPLCYATLNTPPDTASAAVFKRVIQDGLLSGSYCAAMLVPRLDLGAVFPAKALAKLAAGGAVLRLGCGVDRVQINTDSATFTDTVKVFSGSEAAQFDAVICATTPKDACRILPTSCISVALKNLAQQACEPITTIHIKLNLVINGVNLSPPYLSAAVLILPEPEAACPIKHAVIIDRSYVDAAQQGWFTLVLSSSHAALACSQKDLIGAAVLRLQTLCPKLRGANLVEGVVIHAKQATFSCTATLERPTPHTAHRAIVLAGDYVVSDADAPIYPATLESAVRSGLAVLPCIKPI
jgi:hydroxysqualene dehydroxylase